jgi:hypothetical protein
MYVAISESNSVQYLSDWITTQQVVNRGLQSKKDIPLPHSTNDSIIIDTSSSTGNPQKSASLQTKNMEQKMFVDGVNIGFFSGDHQTIINYCKNLHLVYMQCVRCVWNRIYHEMNKIF